MSKEWGFQRGSYNPCLHRHHEWNIQNIVHGVDFASAMRTFESMLKARFEVKTQVVGQWPEEMHAARVLNRIVRVTKERWEHEPDQRHAELITEECS